MHNGELLTRFLYEKVRMLSGYFVGISLDDFNTGEHFGHFGIAIFSEIGKCNVRTGTNVK